MARKDRIKELEAEKGNLEHVIPSMVNRIGQVETARALKTSQGTVSRWLKDHGYINRPYWAKAIAPQERADIDAAAERVNVRRIAQGLPTLEQEEEFS